jgi:hypothetical protein
MVGSSCGEGLGHQRQRRKRVDIQPAEDYWVQYGPERGRCHRRETVIAQGRREGGGGESKPRGSRVMPRVYALRVMEYCESR